MRPIIGVTSSIGNNEESIGNKGISHVSNNILSAVSQSLGIPMILPNLLNEEAIDIIADKIDGLLLSGGNDIDPSLFGEEPNRNLGNITPERDFFEIAITQRILSKNKPILAICRGSQILNIAAGGDMYQDIYGQHNGETLQHNQNAHVSHGSHFVNVDKKSLLYKCVNKTKIKVNSFHHQAVRKTGNGFIVAAAANDGIIEAINSEIHHFVLGVQWHPECMISESSQRGIFDHFVNACKQNKHY